MQEEEEEEEKDHGEVGGSIEESPACDI